MASLQTRAESIAEVSRSRRETVRIISSPVLRSLTRVGPPLDVYYRVLWGLCVFCTAEQHMPRRNELRRRSRAVVARVGTRGIQPVCIVYTRGGTSNYLPEHYSTVYCLMGYPRGAARAGIPSSRAPAAAPLPDSDSGKGLT